MPDSYCVKQILNNSNDYYNYNLNYEDSFVKKIIEKIFLLLLKKIFPLIPFFQSVNKRIKYHGDKTEDADTHEEPGHFKCLTCINDQIPKSAFCGKKFANHDSYKTEPDIYFHVAYDSGNRTWEYYFGQDP